MKTPSYPQFRPRRLRRTALLRQAVADVTLSPDNLIMPLFVTGGDQARPVESMPGVSQLPVSAALQTIQELSTAGLRQFLLFGVTPAAKKDATGSFAADAQAPVNRLLAEVRRAGLDVLMYADLCFCEYTDHGHCGVLEEGAEREERGTKNEERGAIPAKLEDEHGRALDSHGRALDSHGRALDSHGRALDSHGRAWVPPNQKSGISRATGFTVDNDRTLELLGSTAVAQARAGADVVAPSGMMDGMVGAIRKALDEAGYPHTAILSYSVKFASHFYGPFREAGQGGMKFGTRQDYQMDFRRSREWRTELEQDLAEGADMVMVKPAAAYLDVIHQVRQACAVPVVAYHVSGEYAMLYAAAQRGWLDLRQTALETTWAIRRAGADLIITYFAADLLEWL